MSEEYENTTQCNHIDAKQPWNPKEITLNSADQQPEQNREAVASERSTFYCRPKQHTDTVTSVSFFNNDASQMQSNTPRRRKYAAVMVGTSRSLTVKSFQALLFQGKLVLRLKRGGDTQQH